MNRFELDLSILVTQNCIKAADGLIERLGKIPATNPDLWAAGLFKLIMQVFGRCFLHKLLSGRCLRSNISRRSTRGEAGEIRLRRSPNFQFCTLPHITATISIGILQNFREE
jgi:hypothetical protein